MRAGQPSNTALGAAAHRAIHQEREGGAIFKDPFAVDILDEETRASLDQIASDPSQRPLRLFIAARSRFSEDALAACVTRGVRQVVVLGAGLDTFALRNPHVNLGVRVFEVDYPPTQQWKRERIAQTGLAMPASLTFAPVDFERQSLGEGLAEAGFDKTGAAFFQWLGVVPYLTREAILATLDFIAGIPASAVVFDYTEPFENYSPERRTHMMEIAQRAAERGEPWLSFFNPAELAGILSARGFADIEDLRFPDLLNRFFAKEARPSLSGGHVVRAERPC
jgi:methyltransferase (TIGR00027 family)